MSENFYPQPPLLKPKHYVAIGAIVAVAAVAGFAVGHSMRGGPAEKAPEAIAMPPDHAGTARTTTPIAALPDGPVTQKFEEGQLLSYRLDTEIQGGGSDQGDYSAVYMNFGSDATLFTQKIEQDGTADVRFIFENASLAGTFLDSPFEISAGQSATQDGSRPSATLSTPQTDFLATPIDMHVAPDGTILDISSPSSLKDMLGTIATIPHLKFPNQELREGLEWESRLKLPVPGIGDAIDTTVVNKLIGREHMGNYDCGVVIQEIGAKRNNTQASSPGAPGNTPMLFSVPLFDLTGENTIYFDLKTGRLVHAALDMTFALRIKEQLGDAGRFLQQIVPGMAGENGVPELEKMINPDGKPDLTDLSLAIKGALSLVNEGVPAPLPQ